MGAGRRCEARCVPKRRRQQERWLELPCIGGLLLHACNLPLSAAGAMHDPPGGQIGLPAAKPPATRPTLPTRTATLDGRWGHIAPKVPALRWCSRCALHSGARPGRWWEPGAMAEPAIAVPEGWAAAVAAKLDAGLPLEEEQYRLALELQQAAPPGQLHPTLTAVNAGATADAPRVVALHVGDSLLLRDVSACCWRASRLAHGLSSCLQLPCRPRCLLCGLQHGAWTARQELSLRPALHVAGDRGAPHHAPHQAGGAGLPAG